MTYLGVRRHKLLAILSSLFILALHFHPFGVAQILPKATASAARNNSLNQRLFLPPVVYSAAGPGSESLAIADFNQDGKPDVVITSIVGDTGLLLGNGDGTFQPPLTTGTGGSSAVTAADLNGDGWPDFVVTLANLAGAVEALLGNGDGTFQSAQSYPTGGAYPEGVVVADVNLDHKPDLVIANEEGPVFFGGLVAILLGNGDGTFQPPVIYDSSAGDAWSIAVGDLNQDGKPDVIVANLCDLSSCSEHGKVSVLLGNGDGTFQAASTYDSGGLQTSSIAIDDVNGDGKLDVAVVNDVPRNVGVLLGNGDGTFRAPASFGSGGSPNNGPQSIEIADVNGDGRPDLLVAVCAASEPGVCTGLLRGRVGVLLGNGDGTFQKSVMYGTGGFYGLGIAVADVNLDGKPDLLVANGCGDVNCTAGSMAVMLNHARFCGVVPCHTVPNEVSADLFKSPKRR